MRDKNLFFQYFTSKYQKDAQAQRNRWIRNNKGSWTRAIKSKESVMIMNNNSNIMKYGVSEVCNKDVRKQLLEQKDECINALMWPKIKSCAVPDQIRKTQESSTWENQNEGIVLKKYKMRFNRLNVLEDIEEYEAKIIRKMRVGNSKLNKHSKKKQ